MKNKNSRLSLPSFCWPDWAGNPLSECFKKLIWLWRALQTTLSCLNLFPLQRVGKSQPLTHIKWSDSHDSHARYPVHLTSQMYVKGKPMKIKVRIITFSNKSLEAFHRCWAFLAVQTTASVRIRLRACSAYAGLLPTNYLVHIVRINGNWMIFFKKKNLNVKTNHFHIWLTNVSPQSRD